jgi:hypothetical protein
MRVPCHERRLALVGLIAAALLSFAAPASADVGHTIVQRCVLGESLSGFSQSAYSKALRELSATTEEYSDCAAQIRQAQRAAAPGRSSGTSSPASSAAPTPVVATPTEQHEIAGAVLNGSAPLSVGGHLIHPGVIHGNVAAAFSTMPGPLLAAFGFLLVCLLALGAGRIRNRIRDGRTD